MVEDRKANPPSAVGGIEGIVDGERLFSNRGREKRFVRFPLPPNRTGGSPASGSPVDGFTPKGIDEPFHGRLTD